MTIAQAIQNLLLMSIPCVVYAAVVHWRYKLSWGTIANRLGLNTGERRWYLIAVAVTLPMCVLTGWIAQWTKDFQGSMLAPFSGKTPSAELVSAAFLYGLLATGVPEELLFRGLIGGALFRRHSFWRANLIQSVLFMLPHLLILLVAPSLWPLAISLPLLLGLAAGWLRCHSESIGPPVIAHGIPNAVGALAVLDWTG